MIKFTTRLQKFGEQGEKTGWTYIFIPAESAQQLKPDNKKAFRVKGTIDTHAIRAVSLIPMGEGNFILAVNATMRKAIKKQHGAMVKVILEADEKALPLNEELMACLEDEPAALEFFNTLAPGHQRYFSNWISSAKTEFTKTKRIVQAVMGLSRKYDYGTMIRNLKQDKSDLSN